MKKANKIGVGVEDTAMHKLSVAHKFAQLTHVRQEKGITLVALVITIIVLIILAGVSINAVINKGIITNSKYAKDKYEEGKASEETELANLMDRIVENGGKRESVTQIIDGMTIVDNVLTAFDYTTIPDEETKSITVPEGVTSIGKEAFKASDAENSKLSGIILPSTLKTIEDSAFEGCKNMGGIVVPEGVVSIGNNAFTNCGIYDSSFEISLPTTLRIIGNQAFSSTAPSITVPEGVTTIGNEAFAYGYAVWGTADRTITISSTVTSIGTGAFAYQSGDVIVNIKGDMNRFTEEQQNSWIEEGNENVTIRFIN